MGNQVQYVDTPTEPTNPLSKNFEPQDASVEYLTESSPRVQVVQNPENLPEDSLYTSDEVYYPENAPQNEEVVFYYKEEEDAQGVANPPSPPNPVSVYNTNEDSYLAYPSYPPLSQAPSDPTVHSSSTSQDTIYQEVESTSGVPSSQFKRDGPQLVYKSAYTSQDLQNNPFISSDTQNTLNTQDNPADLTPYINEPDTIHTPDGETFYFVGEVEGSNPQLNEVTEDLGYPNTPHTPQNPATPSTVYYKYPTGVEPPAPAAPADLPAEPQKVVYYRQEEKERSTSTPSSAEYPGGTQEVEETPGPTAGSSGGTYIGRRTTTTEKVSTISEEVAENVEKVPESDESVTIFPKPRSNSVKFGFPKNKMKFEIPQEFRTFLNTPPRWINMENWWLKSFLFVIGTFFSNFIAVYVC